MISLTCAAVRSGRSRLSYVQHHLAPTGDPLAEQIHAALQHHPGGLTRSQISQTLNHNQPAGQIDHAPHALNTAGRVTTTQIPTGGRPAQLWTATSPPTPPPSTPGL
jgi:hypothetical protein